MLTRKIREDVDRTIKLQGGLLVADRRSCRAAEEYAFKWSS